MRGPLTGIRVVEMATMVAAPSCGQLLMQLGAEVIKIEGLDGDPYRNNRQITGGHPVLFDALNAGKKSVAINAKNPKAKEMLMKLIGTADVFISNIRLDALKRLGLDYMSLCENESLVYAHFSGYGENGPLSKLPGYDGTAFFVRNGVYRDFTAPDNEPINHISGFGDMISGLAMALNILSALFERNQTGKGRKVSTALNQTAVWTLLMPMIFEQFGSVYQRKERDPFDLSTTCMLCKDGEYIYYNTGMIKQWQALCRVLGKENLINDERCLTISTIMANSKTLYSEIADVFLERNADEWIDALHAADVPCEKYRHIADMASDIQLIENGFIKQSMYDAKSVMIPVPPVESDMLIDAESSKGEELGFHTKAILSSVGFTDDEIGALVSSGDLIVCESQVKN